MKFKKSMKKAWRGLTSEKARVRYMRVGIAMKTGGEKAATYFDKTNRELDRIVGTRDPDRGQLTGVALPKGYKIVKIRPKKRRKKRR